MKKKRILLGLGTFAVLGLTTVLASCGGEKTYTVKFYNGDTEISSQTVTSGYNAEVPETPTADGKVFNGWYADEALTTAFDFGSVIDKDTAVYAAWVNEYAVVFKDGTQTISTQSVISGYTVAEPAAPTADGKVFDGWYADAACTTPFDFSKAITKSTTVYAHWIESCTVTFKDGSKTLSTVNVTTGETVARPTDPTKNGKTFLGWYTDAALTIPFDFDSAISSSTTIYAKFDEITYSVNLYIDADTLFQTISVPEGDTIDFAEYVPTKPYSKFSGRWYTDAALTNLFIDSTSVEEDFDLYAGWEVETEVVTYDFDYDSLIAQYPNKTKPSSITTDGKFYLESGVYFENTNSNPNNGTVQPDINNQQKAIWFSTESTGVLSFDFKGRNNAYFKIYKIAKVDDNTVVPTFTEDELIFDYAASDVATIVSGTQGVISIDLDESATYVIKSSGSGAIYNLKYTDTVEKAAPSAISVLGARDQFLVGSNFESTGLTCTLTYANGSKDVVNPSTSIDATLGYVLDYSNVDLTQAGTYTVNVNYTAVDSVGNYPLSTSYEVKVYAVEEINVYTFGLNSSRETVHNKLVYAKDEALKTTSIYVQAVAKCDGEEYIELLDSSDYSFSSVDTSSTGTKTVTVTYGETEITKSFDIEVVDKLFDAESEYAVVYADASLSSAKKVAYNTGFPDLDYHTYVDDTNATYAFPSVTEALQYLDLCGVSEDALKTLVIKEGTYEEKVYVDMPNLSIYGYGATSGIGSNSGVTITFNAMNGINAPNGVNYSTDGAASFTISKKAYNVKVRNVTLTNYYNTHARYVESQQITTGTQATAVLVRGDMVTFENVSFIGYHDTLYADLGRQYYNDCYIEGRTDYIFGATATAYFNNCTIKTLGAGLTEKNGGYVVATKGQDKQTFGYIFDGCTFTADEQTQDGCVSIARGWDKYMTIMIMNCEIDSHFSKGTYGQTYYEKAFDATTFASALSTGIYTESDGKYTKLSSSAEFDDTLTYYIQLNDRYTRMNADPTPTLLFEYNNTGDGAIAYTAELAELYISKTFTLLDPSNADDQAKVAEYSDFNTVFTASNGSVSYTYNWNPTAISVELEVYATDSLTPDYTYKGQFVYEDNYLVNAQISEIAKELKKVLGEGYTLDGLYIDSEYTTELTNETKITSTLKIYAKVTAGDVSVVTESHALTFGNYEADTPATAGVLDGTGNEWLTVNGSDSKWKSGTPSTQFELGKVSNKSYLKFVVKGTGTLSVSFRNNSGSNDCWMGVSSTDPTDAPTWVKGGTMATGGVATESTDGYWVTTSATSSTITYTLEEGTYYIANTNGRAVRITGISLEDTYTVVASSDYETEEYSLDLTKIAVGADKDPLTEATLGEENGFITLSTAASSQVTQRVSSGSVYAIENTNYGLAVTFKGTGSITISYASTGGSNSSTVGLSSSNDGTGFIAAADETGLTKSTEINNAYVVTGTSAVAITFEVTEAGTYYIACPKTDAYGRGARVSAISMVDKYTVSTPSVPEFIYVYDFNGTDTEEDDTATTKNYQIPSSLSIQNATGTIGDDFVLDVDATTGKLAASSNGYTQFNAGTVISFTAPFDCTVTLESYAANQAAINGVSSTSTTLSLDFAKGTEVKIVGTANGWLTSLTIAPAGLVKPFTAASIAVSGAATEIAKDSTFDASTLVVKAFDSTNTNYITLTSSDYTVSEIDTSSTGTKTVTVTYGTLTASFDVEVVDSVDNAISSTIAITYKGGSYSAAQATETLNHNDATTSVNTTDSTSVTYNKVTYAGGVKTNGADNWLTIPNGGTISFEVSAACSVVIYFYNGSNCVSVDLDGTTITTDSTYTDPAYTSPYTYQISEAGTVTITGNSSGYIGFIEIIF